MDGTERDTTTDTPAGASFNPGAAPTLTEEQLALLRRYGEVRPTVAGQELFREGDRSYDFIVVLSGTVTVLDHRAGAWRELAVVGPGEFVAELNILTGERVFTTAVVREPGAVLVIPAGQLRTLIAQDQALADLILQAIIQRRQRLTRAQAGLTIVGSRRSPDAQRLREFAARIRFPHTWMDLDSDRAGNDVLERVGASRADTPVVVMRGGETLRNPTNADLARAAGFGSHPTPGKIYDLAVIGAGPAGLAASVYATSEGLSAVIIDSLGVGGQIGTTSRIENYLGFPMGVSGDEFAERALIQVQRFGATLLVPSTATGLSSCDDGYVIGLEEGHPLTARSVIIATGVRYRTLNVPGLQRFDGVAVFHTPLAAKEIDPGQPVVIIGGGNSAGQAATWLAHRGHPVTIVIREDDLAADMSRYLIDRITGQPGIEIMPHSAVRGIDGDDRLERVVVEDLTTSARSTVRASAVLILIGAVPHTHWLAGSVELDPGGYVVTGADLGPRIRQRPAWTRLNRDPYLLETSLPGVFAAGDVRSGSVKRVASAVGEGSIAALFVSEHLNRQPDLVPAGQPATGT